MIAFYAVSNLAIFNAVNTKEMYYSNEEADLYIRFVNGTALDLLETVISFSIFKNVYLVNFPTFNKKQGIMGHFPYIRSLFYGRKIQKFVTRYLTITAKDTRYDRMLTLHMDAHAVYFANYFRRFNKKIRIEFLEDGTASYLCTKRYLTNPVKSTLSWKLFLAKKIYEGYYFWRVRNNISDSLYIYYPQGYDHEKGFKPHPLVVQPIGREIMESMAAGIDEPLVMRYDKRHVIYLANPRMAAEPTYDFAYKIIDHIIDVTGHNQLVIKTHSNASTENKEKFAARYESKVFVDRNVYLFESLLYIIRDLEHKIIISRASTAAMLPKLWLNKEPYIILTLRIFPYYGESGDPGGDEYIDLLRSLYSDAKRILVPNTLGELTMMLKECQSEIYNDLYK